MIAEAGFVREGQVLMWEHKTRISPGLYVHSPLRHAIISYNFAECAVPHAIVQDDTATLDFVADELLIPPTPRLGGSSADRRRCLEAEFVEVSDAIEIPRIGDDDTFRAQNAARFAVKSLLMIFFPECVSVKPLCGTSG
jgi:hypothetical protein